MTREQIAHFRQHLDAYRKEAEAERNKNEHWMRISPEAALTLITWSQQLMDMMERKLDLASREGYHHFKRNTND